MKFILQIFCITLTLLTGNTAQATDINILDTRLTASEQAHFKQAVKAAKTGDWDIAVDKAAQILDLTPTAIIKWMKYRKDVSDGWDSLHEFTTNYPDWPTQKRLRSNAERIMPETLSADDVIQYFTLAEPYTSRGARLYGEALLSKGSKKAGELSIAKGWVQKSISADEQTRYLQNHATLLEDLHLMRLDNLIWDKRFKQAKRMYPLMEQKWLDMSEARIALLKGEKGVDGKINKLSSDMLIYPGLAYARMLWRLDRKRTAEATELLIETSRQNNRLGRPEAWAEYRLKFARLALEKGTTQKAYEIASKHGIKEGRKFAELEFLAGWIALRGLNEPERAYSHFNSLWRGVKYPISKARAAYWAGRSLAAKGEKKHANEWYARAAVYSTSFYGQLAAEYLGQQADATLAKTPEPHSWAKAAFIEDSRVRASILLHSIGEVTLARQFIRRMAKDLNDADQLALLGQLSRLMGKPHFAVSIAKTATRKGIALVSYAYPIIDMPIPADAPEMSLSLALARQESEMNPAAESRAGAEGLMQLMPATAREMAGKLDMKYDSKLVGTDPEYNAKLGIGYLSRMLDRFDGSYVLAIASYNAGPGNVKKWLSIFGDPRDGKTDIIDWIESIPFEETRNYVQRVLEGTQVYRARLSGVPTPSRLTHDLIRVAN